MSDHDILEMESDMEDLGDIELGMIEEEVGERTWSFATVVCMLFRSADSVWVYPRDAVGPYRDSCRYS